MAERKYKSNKIEKKFNMQMVNGGVDLDNLTEIMDQSFGYKDYNLSNTSS
jgi:hypothetical protein